jgi:hypothetical protein
MNKTLPEKLPHFARQAYAKWAVARFDRKLCNTDRTYWLFVLGVNNSGTTILSRILESSSEIRTLPAEGQFLTDALPKPNEFGVGRLWSSRMDVFRWTEEHDPLTALQIKKDWANLYPAGDGILLEKSPPNTLRSLWLQKNFRPSRFLAIIREPYAVCEGIARRMKDVTIEQAAQHWVTANRCMLDDLNRLDHRKLVTYEDLVEDPDQCLKGIKEFLGLRAEFDPNELGSVEAHSMDGQTTGLKNLNEKSFERLTSQDVDTINRICAELIERAGYSLRYK